MLAVMQNLCLVEYDANSTTYGKLGCDKIALPAIERLVVQASQTSNAIECRVAADNRLAIIAAEAERALSCSS